ncbi:MAG: ParB/RepB/Spo0J family partition protein [Candidatus Omnitrophota bacterium]|nr:ParB/RepB/Spo0J family partition protein [Candidatus Omnitrophota bacterium]
MEKKVLGKGLAALIPDDIMTAPGIKLESRPGAEEITRIKTAHVKPSPYQPRIEFNKERQDELIASIKEKGFLQPIIVRKIEIGFELIAGERRLRAAKALHIDEIPAIIKNVKNEDALVISIMENIQREELNAIEEAQAFNKLINEFNYTQDAVAQSVGKDRSTVSNYLRLLKLPKEIQKSIATAEITMGHARALLALEDLSAQMKMYHDIVSGNLSVRVVENLIKTQSKSRKVRKISGAEKKDPYVAEMEEQLQHHLGTKVRIMHQKKRGKIVIEYYSNEDLERIAEMIKK